jgi:hypothetical protein
MPALLTTGLAGPADCSTPGSGSASPTRPAVDKSNRFRSVYSLVSDTSSVTLYNYYYSVLEACRSTTSLTLAHAGHRQPGQASHQSEPTGDRDRPAKPSVDERPEAASGRRNGRSPGTTAERPEAVARERPAGSEGLPSTRKGERHGRPEGAPPGRCGRGAVPARWSA